MNFYTPQNDSVKKISYNIYNDALTKVWDTKMLKSADGSSQFANIIISDLDTSFNLQQELKGKVYFVNRGTARDFFYLQNDSVWVHKTISKGIVWELIKEEYAPFYKIDLGNKHFIYWVNSSGLIFKKGGVLKTNFHELEYYYPDRGTQFMVKPKDSVNMNFGYFDYGNFKAELHNYTDVFPMDTSYDNSNKYKLIFPKQDNNILSRNWVYNITDNGRLLLKSIALKYYNDNKLIAFDNKKIYFYSANMSLDSQFHFSAMFKDWSGIEFLVKNKIKKLPLNGLVLAFPDYGRGVCGTVTHYKMQIQDKEITEFVDGSRTNQKSYSQKLILQSAPAFDSMYFMNQTMEMNWSDNGGLDNRVVLFKNGKSGLYKFDIKDSVINFAEILPREFEKITMLNNFVILTQTGHEDILDYYLLNKRLRFIHINYEGAHFLRYQKNNNKMGWLHPDGNLFDD